MGYTHVKTFSKGICLGKGGRGGAGPERPNPGGQGLEGRRRGRKRVYPV